MVKDHSDSVRGNPLQPHGLLFSISSTGYFICIVPQTGYNTYHGLCYTSRGALAGLNGSTMRDRSDDPMHHDARSFCDRPKSVSYLTLPHPPPPNTHTHTHTNNYMSYAVGTVNVLGVGGG